MGAHAAGSWPGGEGRKVAGLMAPASIAELSRCVAAAYADGAAMIPAGCGSKRAWLAEAPAARVISLRQICSVVAHEAADLTVTVEAGATLAELNALLMQAGQDRKSVV